MASNWTTGPSAVGCHGEGCRAQRPWPLHHVRHRGGVFLRLCTSCVLKYHPGSFCTSCFALLDGPSAPPTKGAADLAHCCKCPSVAHLACLANPDLPAQFSCPSCMNPDGFSYLPISTTAGGVPDQKRPTTIDLKSAKVLLAAAKLAAASMNRAAAAARIEAEKKVEVAVVARKRARDMLVSGLRISKKGAGKIKIKDLNSLDQSKVSSSIPEAISPREKNKNSPSPRIEGQKSVHSREREKWMRFHETAFTKHASNQGSSMNNKSERDPNSAEQSNMELKDSAKSTDSLTHNSEHGEKKRLHSDSIKESNEGLLDDKANDPKKPRSTKVASIPR